MSIKMSEVGQYLYIYLSVKCVCLKESKTPDSSSMQLKKYTHLKCSL